MGGHSTTPILSGERADESRKIAPRKAGQRPRLCRWLWQTAYRAFAYLSLAGSKSLSVYSLDATATHFETALAMLDKNPDCASDDQVAEFLVSYTRLLHMSMQVNFQIDVLERYLVRIARLGDDPRAVLIRHQYVLALIWNARYREAAVAQLETSRMADRLGDSRSKAYSLTSEIWSLSICAPKPPFESDALKREAIKAASDTTDTYIQYFARWVVGWEELHRGRIREARDAARELMQVGRVLNDPRSTRLGLWTLAFIALVSDSYTEALEYSEQSLALAITPIDRINAGASKGCALVLLRRTKEGAALLEENRQRSIANGYLGSLTASDGILGVCQVLQGNIALGIHFIEEAIVRRENEGYRTNADWYRGLLAEVYLQIIAGHEKPPTLTLLRNLPNLLKVSVTAPSRIRALIDHVLENPHLDPAGHHVGRAQMILGLLYKANKKRAFAVQHLTEAKRILSQFGQTPILARVETALAELGQ
jgi:hypothetical protein